MALKHVKILTSILKYFLNDKMFSANFSALMTHRIFLLNIHPANKGPEYY